MIPNEKMLLLSIRRPYSYFILSGKKRFELRKRVPKMHCKYGLIYETSPTKLVVGIFTIKQIHVGSVEGIWDKTNKHSCVPKDFFYEYFKNKKQAIAIEISGVKRLGTPIPLSKLGIERPPQDFMYLNNNLNNLIAV